MKTQKENNVELETLDGQITFEDIIESVDDGTYGKPSDTFEVQS